MSFAKDVTEGIGERAIVGLRAAAEHALARAQHHAPVRAIFKRDRRGAAFNQNFKTIRTKSRYEAFLRSKSSSRPVNISRFKGSQTATRQRVTKVESQKGRTYRRPITGASENLAATQAQELVGPGARLSGKRRGPGKSFRGGNNSLMPVFRQGNSRITGDFRNYGGPVGDVVRQKKAQQARGVRDESVERFAKRRSIPNPVESLRVNRLSARGRYETKHAKARGLFQGRVGGRLRGELKITGPHRRGNTIWMYVESPTEYAKFQEFGTGHHRAQPFLRPALYESRNVLRWEVRKAMDKRFNTLPE